ncbi:MAG: type VI secretion system ATPase TssH [Gammaproteobacteria bacterium]
MEFEKLIQKLSHVSRSLFESAVADASSRTHGSIDIWHWLYQCARDLNDDGVAVCEACDLSINTLADNIAQHLEKVKSGYQGFPKISPEVMRWLFDSWLLASGEYEATVVRPIHLLLSLVENPAIFLSMCDHVPILRKLRAEVIRQRCEAILTEEATASTRDCHNAPSALNAYTTDLTQEAQQGRLDPVLCREMEIRQLIDVLCRRRQNNAILTGDAGVGKTAVVEGLAQRIVAGQVPEALRSVCLLSLDLGALQAGASVKGEFEKRLKQVIREIAQHEQPVVLFIDEAHGLVGSGSAGAGDAPNLLKPALARGELRTIAATTWAEYKKYFESDAALTRRFQVVKVEEPNEEQATVMLRSMAPSLEAHHGVVILEEALDAAVRLSNRYITGRQLPDKGVSLLDTACARVALSQRAEPLSAELKRRCIDDASAELERLKNETASGACHHERLEALMAKREQWRQELDAEGQCWLLEKRLVEQLQASRSASLAARCNAEMHDECDAVQALALEVSALKQQLNTQQKAGPRVHDCVDRAVVAAVVSDWTGIPVGRLSSDQFENLMTLEQRLEERIKGQQHALSTISRVVRVSRAGLADPRKPAGIFMLLGPSGVGKTETAMALAETMYGSEHNITIVNMSEFKEEHKVSMLLGAPPGYVGYGQGGVLTEAVRRKPYSVVLLDEIEKAHPGVHDVFYQIFDKGMVRDGEGRDIDFRNTMIVMTSNVASLKIEQLCADPDVRPEPDILLNAIQSELRDIFQPAFLGRVCAIPYYPLTEDILCQIITQQLSCFVDRIRKHYGASCDITDRVYDALIAACSVSDTGARRVTDLLEGKLLPTLADRVLTALAKMERIQSIRIDVDQNGVFSPELEVSPSQSETSKH